MSRTNVATLLLLLLPVVLSATRRAPAQAPPAALAAAPAVRFMGIEAPAKRVAFACDASRWLQTKDEELYAELLRAVEPLAADQQFAVIFFADDKAWGPADGKPMPATPENKQKLRDWLAAPDLGRDSTPAPGLKLAFEGKADALFFVSDGQFAGYDEVARLVASLNPGRATAVHAVGFFLNEGEDDSRSFIEFLRKLAEDNGGQFKVAYAEEMKRRAD